MKCRKKYKDTKNCKHRFNVLINMNFFFDTHNTHKYDPQAKV